ncbi:UDP-N-acetylmuramoylalanyl-D-glutamate--2,6-diaminopimelate ligase [Phenylobacterium sp. Root77]|uniref:UDP-N-acetylmuramoyl-L-alanyl-D-glutamate--2, 6-diaminopimelate ligase n=1 Tax=unclassified Phenylobacterium TaxID=2640670 RepID=UPI0006FCCA6E|nr:MULTISPECIES: UDP-N-acetylmuramoyl-L-alanyl-D-glutamate--2,6-diaminopimelate ligase [unclassified Phenylobacterium]KQW72193.1 UDP-N-acetylmuramoylalanyl-D-glutamate--2,6-diaminopimelate ligase [Phenylobacterium sp. Root1277]KQW95113.1 UDP-N-acetylmuramoylalanyl-D-glutamate--2,6-diaminopimelate ligase [Phenylobacterium sp. Root1290]KRC44806.1 UDP-N-acetylmuramoylalanyl-D-glutamate--2,6-diaminopimelate ligase [Phenylobacterium sp. Root77]
MGKPLSQLVQRTFATDPQVVGVTADSRKVKPGFLFAALPGSKVDGKAFAVKAVAAGAVAVISAEDLPDLGVPVIVTPDPRRMYALAAKAFWGVQPPVVIAVTGTNGKTSVAAFCRQIFNHAGKKAASMGTLGVRATGPGLDEQITPPGLTTPDAADVAELMSVLVAKGVTHLAMEASSHGVDQRRLDGVGLVAAGFLNLTQDHLDYHHTMEAYRDAKLRLFEALLPRGGVAVLNADSEAYGAFAAAAVGSGQSVFSVGEAGQGLKLVERTPTPDGQTLKVEAKGKTYEVRLPLAGAFQASNVLVAAGLCIAAGEPVESVLAALATLEGAPGRMQRIGTGPKGGEAYVDYAHTPDGLETVLKSLRPHVDGKLIVVFGAGGDRDRAKRPLMGLAAAQHADVAIVTDDNPRSEVPAAIRAEILAGAPGSREVGDRREAIRAGVALLGPGDVLVVAGKGHEQSQTVGSTVHFFDDVAEVAAALEAAHV